MNTEKRYRYRDQYEYRKMIQFFEDNISTGFKLFTIIKERIIVELSSRQAGMQANIHSSEAK